MKIQTYFHVRNIENLVLDMMYAHIFIYEI